MPDPQTTNKFLNQPIPGTDVGTWGTPINNNFGIIDNSFGGVATIALTNSPVTLSPSQYQCAFLTFTGAISANIAITLPAVGSFYTVINQTTNSSAFFLTMLTTAGGGQVIGVPPGETTDIFTDGTNVKITSLPHIGSYWDYAGSSTPAWVTACTIPPWLYCNGTTFSSATYPELATILNSTTLPDFRGRFRAYINDGTTRITSTMGLDGNTIFASGGGTTFLTSQNMPPVPYTDPGHRHSIVNVNAGIGSLGPIGGTINTPVTINSCFATIDITIGSTTPTSFAAIPPAVMGGITMIRAG